MPGLGSIGYKGSSENIYTFRIYDFNNTWDPTPAVYIVTRRESNDEGGYNHTTIYIGQTDDLKKEFSNHPKQNCFIRKRVNCVSILTEKNEEKRLSIANDLLASYNPSCNK